MQKLRVLKAIAVVVLIAFSLQNIASANPDIFMRNTGQAVDTLAPELHLQKRGIESQSLMFLVDIARQALQVGVKPEKLAQFIKSASTITPEIAERIDFGNITIAGGKIYIGYNGESGLRILTFYSKPEHIKGKMPPSEGRIQIADIIVEIRQHLTDTDEGIKDGQERTEGPDTGDVTGSSESNAGKHEANKVFKPGFRGYFGKWLGKKFGIWVIRSNRGVNDVIRSFWKNGAPQKGCVESEEMPLILRALSVLPHGADIEESILKNKYKLYVYDTGRPDFIDGVTTHYGIRTGSVHITKLEYERLKSLGMQHLAARIVHEVSEIDNWRKKANDLIKDGRIDELGAIPGEYDENWASGIRKWIRDNCEDSGLGVAQQLGREFHRKGVEREIAILSEWILFVKAFNRGEQYYEAVKKLSHEFMSGRYADFINNPALTLQSPSGMYGDIFKSILDAFKHFRTKRDRKFFINSLYVRSTLNYARSLNAGIDAEFAAQKDTSVRSRKTLARIEILKDSLNDVNVIDSITRVEIEEWVDEIKKAITNFSTRDKGIFGTVFAKLIKLVSQKHRAEGWDSEYVVDPNDFVGSASEGEKGEDGSIEESDEDILLYPDDDKSAGSSTGTGPSDRFGIMFSPAVANCVVPQQNPITRTLDVDPGIINILARYKNWNYQDITERARSTSTRGGTKRDTTARSLQRSTSYLYIDRFDNENIFRKRLGYAASSAQHLINNKGILEFTKGSGNFRIFYGSNSGYFDVYDKNRNYAHQIEITILVDGKKELQTEAYGPQSDIMGPVMREFMVQPGEEDVFAPIRGITLNVVGTETIREAFQGQPGMVLNKEETERRAELQRMFVRLYREDIQVAGSNFVEEDKEFAERLPSFERVYISEFVGRLDRIVEERQRLQDERNRVSLAELSPDDERKLVEIQKSLEDDEKRRKELEARLTQVKERKGKLEEERKRLTTLGEYFKEYVRRREAGEVITTEESTKYNEAVKQYNQELEVYRQDLESVSQEDGSIKGEQGSLQKNMARKLGVVKDLAERKRSAKKMRQAFEFQMQNIERHYELVCKRIEDAQVGHPLTTGVVINNRYKVLDMLGEGGFGRVYRVRDRELNTEKAIKIMNPTQHMSVLDKQKALQGFDRELASLISLRTKGAQVPYVEGKGVYAGSQFIVMSLEKGLTLEEIILKCEKGEMQLSLRQRLLLMYGIAKTMANFHACEYIHRDLKPANMMVPVNEDGSLAIPNIGDTEQLMKSASFDAFVRNIRILDLGSAIPGEISDKKATGDFREKADRTNLTGEGTIRGTPWYMAPEQCVPSKDNPASSKTDIYAMGVLFYRFLSQHFPRGEGLGEGWNNIVLSHCSPDPVQFLSSMVDWENGELRKKREEKRDVNSRRVNAIRDGLVKALARETKPERRIMGRGKGGKLVWAKKLADETVLIETLGNIAWLTDVERDKIRALILHKVPQVDGFVEAIVHKMLEGISQDSKGKITGQRGVQKDRPTAIEVAHELEKYLTGKKDEMLWRPRGEKKGRIVKTAEWLQKHYGFVAGIFLVVIGALGALVVFLFMLYERASTERSLAVRETQQAREERKAALAAAAKAKQDVQEAEDKMRQLQEEREKIQGNLATLKEEKGTVEAQKKSLSEQVKALSDKAKKAVELEGQLKELEKRVRELNDQEGKLKEREQELNRRIKESRDRLAKAEAELQERRMTLSGVFEDAKTAAQKFEAEKALGILDGRLSWWTIDKTNLKKFTLGYDELSKIMADNGQIDEALKLEEDRVEKLTQIIGWKDSEEEKLSFREEIVKAQLMIVKLHQSEGDYASAERYAQALMRSQEYKTSKERMEALRETLVGMVLEAAFYAKDEKERKLYAAKAELHIGLLKAGDIKNFYNAYLYLARGEYKQAVRYFGYYSKHWEEKVKEKGIAPGVKSQREREAARTLFLTAVTYKQQALYYKGRGSAANAKTYAGYGINVLDKISKNYPKQKDVLAWAAFLRGDLLALQGEADKAKEAYEAAKILAASNKLLLVIVNARLGEPADLTELIDTWSAFISGKIPIPIPLADEIKKLMRQESTRLQKAVEEAKRKAEEEAQRKAEEKRKAEEAREARRQKEEAGIKSEALTGLKTEQGGRVRLVQVNKTIQTLTRQIGLERDARKRADMEKQLERARKKKGHIERFIEEQKKRIPEEGQPKEGQPKDDTPGKTPDKDDKGAKDEGDKGAGKKPDDAKKRGIGSNVLDAPDERIVDALIECAFEDSLFSQVETDGIREVFLGTDTTRTFHDIYKKLPGDRKQRLWMKFEVACRQDQVPDMVIKRLFEQDLEKLKNISGHAGRVTWSRPDVKTPSIYLARGFQDRETLRKHEIEELKIHLEEAAKRAGFGRWKNMPEDVRTRALAIKRLESMSDYNAFAIKAHQEANAKYPVSEDEEVVPDGKAKGKVLDITSASRRRPIAAAKGNADAPKPIFVLTVFFEIVQKLSDAFASIMKTDTRQFAVAGNAEIAGKSVIIYADDVMDCSAVFDIKKVAEITSKEGGVIGKIVLYAKDQRKADLIEKMILDANPQANVAVVTEEDIKEYYGKDFYTTSDSQLETIMRYSTNKKSGIFRKGEVLGVIRGPLTEKENAVEMEEELKRLNLPVVVFEDNYKGNVYSIMQALSKLVEIRSGATVSERLLFILPPITRVSKALEKEYRTYKAMMKALESSA